MSPDTVRSGPGGRRFAGTGILGRGLLPLALLAALVSPAQATADSPPAPAPTGLQATDRGKAVQFWIDGGPAVKAAAETALTGSDQDIQQFLQAGRAAAEYVDDKEAAQQVVSQGGQALRAAAQQALAGTPQDLDAFIRQGWQKPLEQDQVVEAARIGNTGGPGVKAAADAALNGSMDQVKAFLNHDQYTQRDTDDLVRAAQVEGAGGPVTKAAAALAFDGSIDDVREFLASGQYVARAHDQEYASVAQLVEQTKAAGALAESESQAAKDSSARAVAAAALAKDAARTAADETKAAQNDATRAAEASRRAAEATRRAAEAAQAAVTAARKATASARLANAAASNAAYAAAQASQAAGRALSAAAAGAVDGDTINKALVASNLSSLAVDWADRASRAAQSVKDIADAVKGISTDLNAAIAAADEAGGYADQAGADASETKAAAASTRRYAAEATRASTAASGLATDAAQAAADARDAARDASTRAANAATAAKSATSHAGDAAAATEQARIHSEAAKNAADAAGAAVEKAKAIESAARKADAEEITARTNAGRNQAEDLTAAYLQTRAEAARLQDQTKKLGDDFTALAARAAQPGVDQGQIVKDGRKMAVTAMKISGAWSRAAAEYALAGSDNAVAAYALTGWQSARQADERDQVLSLGRDSTNPTVRAAAKDAATGDAARIHTFLETGQYDVASADYGIQVARIGQDGGPGVKAAADAALNANTAKALVDFLTTTQFTARETDDRVVAASLANSGGPEVKAAAEAALVSPPGVLRTFVTTGQYQAQRQDQLTLAHVAHVQQAIAEAGIIAARARQSSDEAGQAYAVARGATDEANNAAAQARADAAAAATASQQAQQSAHDAEQSAAQAASYAKTAQQAREKATSSAAAAAGAVRYAQASAGAAADSAGQAYAAAAAAQLIAEKAGQDAKTINATFTDALDHAREQEQAWEEGQRMIAAIQAQTYQNLPSWMKGVIAFNALPLDKKAEAVIEVAHLELDLLGTIPVVGAPANLANCGTYGMEGAMGDPAKYEDAALSCAAEVPIEGWGVLGAKLERWGVKSSKIAEALKSTWRETVGSGCISPNSFPAGTRVLLADGSSRPIEQLHIGDQVAATDPQSGVTGPQRVDATFYTPDDRDFTDLTIVPPDGRPAQITSTDHHPYWSQSHHAWRDAAQLGLDDTLRTPDGRTARITLAVHESRPPQAAYNLTVANVHTYYVLAGGTPVLVHNAESPICAWLTEQIAAAQAANPLIDSLRATGKLPGNFYTKDQARAMGWEEGKAFGNFVKDGQIGGDEFNNTTGIMPDGRFRIWYEADVAINPMMKRSKQPGWRLLYSNDGLAYVTSDHYKTTYRLPNWK